jgi:hypothetical protein
MRNFAVVGFLSLAALLPFAPSAMAQQATNPGIQKPGLEVPVITPGPGWKTCPRCKNEARADADRKKENVDARPFDKHDISGVWSGTPANLDDNGSTFDVSKLPPFTPDGQKLYEATLSDSPEWSSKDPMNICDPLGYPRSFAYNYGIEFAALPGRIVEFFEWGHYWRDIWTDGRKLPPNPPIPRFYGYAVGKWDGDTFVVDSNGYDDRSWIVADNSKRNAQKRVGGFPHSDEMTIREGYKRVNYGLLQVTITITDPKVYSAPWTTTDVIALSPDSEIAEHLCVTSDAISYNDRNNLPALSTTQK